VRGKEEHFLVYYVAVENVSVRPFNVNYLRGNKQRADYKRFGEKFAEVFRAVKREKIKEHHGEFEPENEPYLHKIKPTYAPAEKKRRVRDKQRIKQFSFFYNSLFNDKSFYRKRYERDACRHRGNHENPHLSAGNIFRYIAYVFYKKRDEKYQRVNVVYFVAEKTNKHDKRGKTRYRSERIAFVPAKKSIQKGDRNEPSRPEHLSHISVKSAANG